MPTKLRYILFLIVFICFILAYNKIKVLTDFDISCVGRLTEDYFKWITQTAKINAPFKHIIENLLPKNKKPKIITIELEEL
jgi:hypothetical protein